MRVLGVVPFFLSYKYTDPSNLDQRGKKVGRENPLPETTEALAGVQIGQGQHAATGKKPSSSISAF